MLQINRIQRPRALAPANLRRLSALIIFTGILFASIMPFSPAPAPLAALPGGQPELLQAMLHGSHHDAALSRACISKASHIELYTFCKDEVAQRTRDAMLLQSWLSEWHGQFYRAYLKEDDLRLIRMLLVLPLDGFEVYYLDTMIARKQAAAGLAQTCLGQPARPELGAFCTALLSESTREQQLLQNWQCAWYGRCVPIAAGP